MQKLALKLCPNLGKLYFILMLILPIFLYVIYLAKREKYEMRKSA